MITITLIRHGESTDNLLPIWAGWRDTPLSELGKKQVEALARNLSGTRFDAVHASTLKRALWTGEAVLKAQPEPKPPLYTSPALREQTRGIAEGHPWLKEPIPGLSLEEHYAKGLFPIHHERWQSFPGGESLDDLQKRAGYAIEEVIMPYVRAVLAGCPRNVHIAIASHGLLIAEMVPLLLKLSIEPMQGQSTYRGMQNSGWTRVTIQTKEGAKVEGDDRPPIVVKMTDFNRHEHLEGVKSVEQAESAGERDAVQTYSAAKL